MQVAVLGAGSWGTALAIQLARAGNVVRLWDRNMERAAQMQKERENHRYLPEIPFPDSITVASELDYCLLSCDMVVSVIPSQYTRIVLTQALPHLNPLVPICCASKGIERGTLMTMEEVFREVLPRSFHAQLSFGRSFFCKRSGA